MPANTISVTRPGRWGNPVKVTPVVPASVALQSFLIYLGQSGEVRLRELVEPLRGRDLACFCSPSALCHADVWLWLAADEQHLVKFCTTYAAATCKVCWAMVMMVVVCGNAAAKVNL